MKRFVLSILIILSLTVTLMPMTAFATEGDVRDNADLLLSPEETILRTRAAWLAEEDITFVIDTEHDPFDREALDAFLRSEFSDARTGLMVLADENSIEARAFGTENALFTEAAVAQINAFANERRAEFGFYSAMKSVVVNTNRLLRGEEIQTDGDFFQPAIWDTAGFLSDSERSALSDKLDEIRNAHHVDVAVMTSDSLYGDTAMEAADDIYDYYFYGYGANDDGLLLYINRDPREYWITTYGEGERAFTDNGIEYLKSLIVPYLKENDYSGAVAAFADGTDELLTMKEEGRIYNEKPPRSSGETALPIVLAVILPAIIAFLLMGHKVGKMNTVNRQLTAQNYVTPGGMEVTSSKDIFLYSHVTKTRKAESSSGGSHSSSSGRSHGGGGGSY